VHLSPTTPHATPAATSFLAPRPVAMPQRLTCPSPSARSVLVFSGDHDMCVPHTGSEAWTSALGSEAGVMRESEAWRAYLVDDSQVPCAPKVDAGNSRAE